MVALLMAIMMKILMKTYQSSIKQSTRQRGRERGTRWKDPSPSKPKIHLRRQTVRGMRTNQLLEYFSVPEAGEERRGEEHLKNLSSFYKKKTLTHINNTFSNRDHLCLWSRHQYCLTIKLKAKLKERTSNPFGSSHHVNI